jgi:hypothetical protein
LHRPADGIFHRIGDGSADGCDAALAGPFDAEGSDEILQTRSIGNPSQSTMWWAQVPSGARDRLGGLQREWMTLIEDLDLATYCG